MEWVLILTSIVTVLSAWLLGGVNDFVYAGAAVGGLLSILLIAVDNWRIPRHAGLWSSLLPWLFLLPIALGAIQIMPIPGQTLRKLSPRGYHIRDLLAANNAGDEFESVASPGEELSYTLSLVPSATRYELAKYWVVCAFLMVGMYGLSSGKRRRTYLTIVLANGSLIAFFALIQRLSWNGKVFWFIDAPRHTALGPFINKNNAAGYLLLVLAAAMALLVRQFHRPQESNYLASLRFSDRLKLRIGSVMSDNGRILQLAALTVLWIAVLISMSRGAFAGAVAATLFTVATIWRRRIASVFLALGVSLVFAWALISWSQQTDRVTERIASIKDQSHLESLRVLHWGDDLRMANDFLTTGVGIGAYPFANRPYKSFVLDAWHLYSENQYLESLIVGGVFGLVLLLSFLLVAWKSVWRLAKERQIQARQIATLGTFALTGQMVAGFFDFGLYNAANGILFACLVGMVVGCATQVAGPNRLAGTNRALAVFNYRTWLVVTMALGVLSVSELTLRANVEREMHWSRRKIHVQQAGYWQSQASLEGEIVGLSEALRIYPDHPYGHARLANLHIMRFRLALFEELKSFGGQYLDDETLWSYTDPFVVSSRLQSQQRGDTNQLTNHRLYVTHLVPAWNSLVRAREVNPFSPHVHYLMALLQPIAKPDNVDPERHITRMAFLEPNNANLMFNAGMLLCQAGDREQGLDWIRRAATLSSEVPAHVATFAKTYLTPQEFVDLILPRDANVILKVVTDHYEDSADNESWRVALGSRAIELLELQPSQSATAYHFYQLGLANFYRGQPKIACEFYAQAVKQEPIVASWRLAYAKSLAASGDMNSALREAKLSLRLMPNSWRARQFVRKMESQIARKKT